MYEWGDIRIFLAVVKEGSTLGASRKLGMNQTTVSRRIQVLEHALGLQLFDRDTRGYNLTAMGKGILELGSQMQVVAEDLQTRATNLQRSRSGCIRISTATDTAECWVLPVANAFREKYPDVQFDIDDTRRQVNLAKGEADIAFRATDEIEDETLIARKFGQVTWAVYCGKACASESGLPRSFEDLKDRDILFYPEVMTERIQMLRYFRNRILPGQITATYNSTASVAGSLSLSSAVGFLPIVMARTRPDLVFCFAEAEMEMPVWLVTSRESYESPIIREFMEFTANFGHKDGVTLK